MYFSITKIIVIIFILGIIIWLSTNSSNTNTVTATSPAPNTSPAAKTETAPNTSPAAKTDTGTGGDTNAPKIVPATIGCPKYYTIKDGMCIEDCKSNYKLGYLSDCVAIDYTPDKKSPCPPDYFYHAGQRNCKSCGSNGENIYYNTYTDKCQNNNPAQTTTAECPSNYTLNNNDYKCYDTTCDSNTNFIFDTNNGNYICKGKPGNLSYTPYKLSPHFVCPNGYQLGKNDVLCYKLN